MSCFRTIVITICLTVFAFDSRPAWADAFQPPTCGGTWVYRFDGDSATRGDPYAFNSLDGTWDYRNGSDAWDGSGPGDPPPQRPGGLKALTEGATTFVRMQDTGDPRDYGFSEPSNRKFLLGHALSSDLDAQTAGTILDNGVTLSFRARIVTPAAGGPLDNLHPDGGSGIVPWPEGGDGYLGGNFIIRQEPTDELILFSLALASDKGEDDAEVMNGRQGLVMNRLNGSSPTSRMQPGIPSHGTMNILDVADMTVWHEYWITIERGGAGTHQVTVWMDGDLTPKGVFDVTAGTEADFTTNYIAFGMPMTFESGAIDMDFFQYRPGAIPPTAGPCYTLVKPSAAQSVTAVQGFPADSLLYTLTNCGSPETVNYTVTELDENQVETDVPWLLLNKTSGTLEEGQSDQVAVQLDSAVTLGAHKAFLKFTDTCDPENVAIREIDFNVLQWGVDGCGVLRGYLLEYPDMPVADAGYVIKHAGPDPMTYTITKSDPAANWLLLSSDTGVIGAGGTASMAVSFDPAALEGQPANEVYRCTLTFSSTATPDTYSHTVRFRYMGPGTASVFFYDGTIDPEADNSAGPGLRFRLVSGGELNGAVEHDSGAQNRFAWHIADPVGAETLYRTQVWDPVALEYNPLDLYSEFGGTIVARMKVTAWDDVMAGGLYAWDEDGSNGSMSVNCHWGGADGRVAELLRGQSTSIAGTSDYVVLRMTTKGRRGDFACDRAVRVYVNEEPTPVLEIPRAEPRWSPFAGLGFGAGSSVGTMDVWYDWVTATNAGAFAPGEELATLGRSLIPEFCHVPFADADRDGDIDQTDFAEFQRCITNGTIPVSEECKCFDRPEEGLPYGDGVIDADDFLQFARCATGPSILWSEETMAPDCEP